jgi:mannose-6-phosphate isomerase
MTLSTRPQRLPLNQFEHFYRAGDRLAALRGGHDGQYRPEEWLASTTTRAGQGEQGLSRLADGTLLRDAIEADAPAWLGADHVAAFGASTELLVKLLDAGERLPVHLHPNRAFSRRHLGLAHGKTEAWIVLDVAEGAQVRLGFADTMTLPDVRAMVDKQDSTGLVQALVARPVHPGDAVLVPSGLPHCIDAGVFVLELQEPTDLSILLEWDGFAVIGPDDAHLGLGLDVALQALELSALQPSDLDQLVLPRDQVVTAGPASLLPARAEAYFRAHRVSGTPPPAPVVDAGFAVVLVTRGAGRLVTDSGDHLDVTRGDVAVVPWAAGTWRLDADVEGLVCRPPLPAFARTAS